MPPTGKMQLKEIGCFILHGTQSSFGFVFEKERRIASYQKTGEWLEIYDFTPPTERDRIRNAFPTAIIYSDKRSFFDLISGDTAVHEAWTNHDTDKFYKCYVAWLAEKEVMNEWTEYDTARFAGAFDDWLKRNGRNS